MSYVFASHAVITATGEVIPFKFIESMRIKNEDDEIVDKLKGDVCIDIRTLSGKDYTISMNVVHQELGGTPTGKNLAQSIFDKWIWIHKPN